MSQLNNDALYEALSANGFSFGDDFFFFAGAPTTQAGGASFKSEVHRVAANAVANAAMVLKSLLSNDANLFSSLINDSPNTVTVFPAKQAASLPQESMNGVANASFAVTAGNSAIFIGTPVQIKRKGGTSGGGTLNWAAALIS